MARAAVARAWTAVRRLTVLVSVLAVSLTRRGIRWCRRLPERIPVPAGAPFPTPGTGLRMLAARIRALPSRFPAVQDRRARPGGPSLPRTPVLLGGAVAAVAVVVVLVSLVAAVRPAPPPTASPTTAATTPPPPTRARVLTYLTTISGVATVAGQHNREPLARPTMWTDEVRSITDSTPGLYGSDFAFTAVVDRPKMVAAAIRQWRAGSLVTLMWHMCPPGMGQTCDWKRDVQSRLTDAQWQQVTTPGTALNRAWMAQIDVLVPYLQQLQQAGVEVLWRPVHELNDDWAWWGGRPGPSGSSLLFRMMHDHLSARGLTNLVWVWSVKDVDVDRFADYYPGDRYVDVVGLDSWMSPFPSQHTYDQVRAVAQGKPIALAEVGTVPTPSQLAQQPRWTYFMVWAEMLTQRSSLPRIQYTYGDRRVLTQGRITLPASP